MNKKYSAVAYIGRFEPPHVGHLHTIQQISQLAERVIVLVGSANSPRTIKNPFTFEERKQMIKNSAHVINLSIMPINDYTYDDPKWIRQISNTVEGITKGSIAIAGFDKDETSKYLNYFPQWDLIKTPEYKEYGNTIHATEIRQMYFDGQFNYLLPAVPPYVFDKLIEFVNSNEHAYTDLVEEYMFTEAYKKQWANSPYPPIFVTVDAVVIQSGHVLLIQRKSEPGKNLWAMPGGFVNSNELLIDSMIRELREETKVKVPKKVLLGNIKDQKVFDSPLRSLRGRTITHAYLIKLEDNNPLPDIRGNDDAKEAKWIPLSEFYEMADRMFEDHFSIIENMINRL